MSAAPVATWFRKRLRGLGPLVGLLSLVAACGDGDHAGAPATELNLLQSSCLAEAVVTSGLVWECRGPCIAAPCDDPSVHLSREIDTSTIPHITVSHGLALPACDGFFFPPAMRGDVNVWLEHSNAISETNFAGIMKGLIPCLGTEVICEVISNVGDGGAQPVDLLSSECLAREIFSSGLAWRCEGTCHPITCPFPSVTRTLDTGADILAPECNQLVSQDSSDTIRYLRASTETKFRGFMQTAGCDSLADMVCTPAPDFGG